MSWLYKTAASEANYGYAGAEPVSLEFNNSVMDGQERDYGCRPPQEWLQDGCGCEKRDFHDDYNDDYKDFGKDYGRKDWDWKREDQEECECRPHEPKHLKCWCWEEDGECDRRYHWRKELKCKCVEVKHDNHDDKHDKYDKCHKRHKFEPEWFICWCKPCFPKPKPCDRHEYWDEE